MADGSRFKTICDPRRMIHGQVSTFFQTDRNFIQVTDATPRFFFNANFDVFFVDIYRCHWDMGAF